jgi:hypothetical protein
MAPYCPEVATERHVIDTRIQRKPWGKTLAEATSPGQPNLPLSMISGPGRQVLPMSGAVHHPAPFIQFYPS